MYSTKLCLFIAISHSSANKSIEDFIPSSLYCQKALSLKFNQKLVLNYLKYHKIMPLNEFLYAKDRINDVNDLFLSEDRRNTALLKNSHDANTESHLIHSLTFINSNLFI
jgi:hypothetical protein